MGTNRLKAARIIAGIVLIIVGIISLVEFNSIKNFFLFLSPDKDIVPHSLLQLRILLISFGLIGILLAWWQTIVGKRQWLDEPIKKLSVTRFVTIILATAFILRLLIPLVFPFRLWIDYMVYDELAAMWVEYGCYCVDGIPTAYRPPGYPFFLSRLYMIFGQVPIIGAFANVFLSTGIVILTYLIARNIFGERIARWAAIIMLFFPSQLLFVNLLASEPLFTLFFLISVYCFLIAPSKDSRASSLLFTGGLFLGLATLTRALTLIFLVLPIIYWYLKSKSLKKTLIFIIPALLSFLLVISPWMFRNYDIKGKFTISLNRGINLLIGNQPGSGMGWNQAATEHFDIGNPQKEAAIDSAAWHRGWEYIGSDPVGFIKRGILKVGYFYAVDLEGIGYELTEEANKRQFGFFSFLGILIEAYYLNILLLAAVGIYLLMGKRQLFAPEVIFIVLIILYWTGVHFVFFADGRFHFPIITFIAILASNGIIGSFHQKS